MKKGSKIKALYATTGKKVEFCQRGTATRLVKLMGELQTLFPTVKYQIK